jgi:hypothetical protein
MQRGVEGILSPDELLPGQPLNVIRQRMEQTRKSALA